MIDKKGSSLSNKIITNIPMTPQHWLPIRFPDTAQTDRTPVAPQTESEVDLSFCFGAAPLLGVIHTKLKANEDIDMLNKCQTWLQM